MQVDGFEFAKRQALEFLETFKQGIDPASRDLLQCVARTALRTKLEEQLADHLTDAVTDAVLCIKTKVAIQESTLKRAHSGAQWRDNPEKVMRLAYRMDRPT